MSKLFFLAFCVVLLTACDKEPPVVPAHPKMQYVDLQNAEIGYNDAETIDLDKNGQADLLFATGLFGDPILKTDRLQFTAKSNVGGYLLKDEQEQSPVLNKEGSVSSNHPGYTWRAVTKVVLTEKVMTVGEASYWAGLWKNASHQYLPVQIKRNELSYFGWVELSVDTNKEKLILHKAAICEEAGKTVQAGI